MINRESIGKYMDSSSWKNSANLGVHVAVLQKLPEVIAKSVLVETHPDRNRDAEGKGRSTDSINENGLIHRLYGAVLMTEPDGSVKTYRVKTTLRENNNSEKSPNAHNYEVTEIELIEASRADAQESNHASMTMTSNSSITGAKLLIGVEKSYDPGKKLLDESEKSSARFSIDEAREQSEQTQLAHKAVMECLRRGGIEVEAVTREQAMAKAEQEGVNMLENTNGTVYGWTEDGRIFLSEDGLDAETPVHEYTHLWVAAMQKNSPKAWKNIVSLLKGTEMWNVVVRDPMYDNLRGDENAIASEVLSRIGGAEGRRRFEEEAQRVLDNANTTTERARITAMIDRTRRAARSFWAWVGQNLFGIKKFKSIDEVTDRMLYDLTRGTKLDKGDKEKSLVGVHNISVDKIRRAMKMGGFANPSVAVIDVDRQLHDGFGEISLVIPSEKLNKGKEGSGGTYTGDAWTPSYPRVSYDMTADGVQKLVDDLELSFSKSEAALIGDWYMELFSKGRNPFQGDDMLFWFLKERGVTPKRSMNKWGDIGLVQMKSRTYLKEHPEMLKDFESWKQERQELYEVKELVSSSTAYGGKQVTLPHTLDNVSKIMNMGRSHGVGNGMAALMRPMKGTDDISKQQDRLVSSYEDLNIFDQNWEEAYRRTPYLTDESDLHMVNILGQKEYYKMMTQPNPIGYLKSKHGIELEEHKAKLFQQHIDAIRNERPAVYFETKFERPVMFNEFAAAVVPENTPADVVDFLRSQGLQIETYEADNKASRQEAMQRATQKEGVRFRVGYNGPTVEEVNEKFNSELERFEKKELPVGHRFDLGMPSEYLLSAGFPELPIVMRQSLLATKSTAGHHPFEASDLKDLVKAIQKPIGIFKYTKSNMRNLIVDVVRGDKHFLVGVTLNYNGGAVEVNSVSGLFPKQSIEWLKWIQDNNGEKIIRLDQKEKIQAIIESQRTTNTSESSRIGLNLDTVAKIVENFENPKLPSEKEATNSQPELLYREREKPAPKKTRKVYKLMRLKNGKLYPLFIDAAMPTELGVWYDADSPALDTLRGLAAGQYVIDNVTEEVMTREEFDRRHPEMKSYDTAGNYPGKYPSKAAINYATDNNLRWVMIEETENAQKRFDGENRRYWNLGINGAGKDGSVSPFSMRPGWHAGSLPTMRQIGKGTKKDLRDDSFVWVEGEVSADIDYQSEAEQNPDKDMPDRIPVDGFYLKATNADAAKSQADRVGWYVAGAFKANRIISDAEARKVIDEHNARNPESPVEYDYKRESGGEFDPADYPELQENDRKHAMLAERAQAIADRLGVKIRIITDEAEVAALSGSRQRNAKGWFNTRTGEVVVVAPNHIGYEDIENTVLHEVVGHKGLRRLVGEERFAEFIDNVYKHATDAMKAKIDAYMPKEFDDSVEARRIATEEYLSDLAGRIGERGFENMAAEEKTLWAKVCEAVQKLIDATLKGLGCKGVKLSEKQMSYVVYKSWSNLRDNAKVDAEMRAKTGYDLYTAEAQSESIESLNEKFNTELQLQIDGKLPQGHVYSFGKPGAILRAAGFPDAPIEMSSTRLAEKSRQGNHPFDISDVKDLVKLMNNPIGVFRYGNNAKNVIVGIERDGKQYLVGVHFNQNYRGAVVSDIRGIFPKDNAEWLNWIVQEKSDYLDKEKIQELIAQQRINLAEVGYLNLDDVAKVVENFENPAIEGEKNETLRTRPDSNLRFRVNDDVVTRDRVMARALYEARVASSPYQVKEAMLDSMLGLHEAYMAIEEANGRKRYIEDIPTAENAYTAENAMSSSNDQEQKLYERTMVKGITQEAAKIAKNEAQLDELRKYLMAKHGLERNAYMRNEAVAKAQAGTYATPQDQADAIARAQAADYSGLTVI